MFDKLLYLFLSLIFVLSFHFMMLSIDNDISPAYESSISLQESINKDNKVVNNHVVITEINHAYNFSHFNQRNVVYLLVNFIAIFFVCVVNYLYYKSIILPPPWYIILKYRLRLSLSGWKVSNLLYKTKLAFHF